MSVDAAVMPDLIPAFKHKITIGYIKLAPAFNSADKKIVGMFFAELRKTHAVKRCVFL